MSESNYIFKKNKTKIILKYYIFDILGKKILNKKFIIYKR